MKQLFFAIFFAFPLFGADPSYRVVPDENSYTILTPTLSERKFQKLILENGMNVYLVSDPGIDKSAAAVCVCAGSWQDPEEYPGMAHFLEHMLFMGTKTYPNESEYMAYIQDHGGTVNAFTASDRTVYMFSINNDQFIGALDRFSHFFIDPLFNPSCINRELNAVDQEHSKNIENDSWREYMVLKETGNPDHPNHRFSTGNAKTLSGIPQKALKTWYETHYSADQMYLVILSNLPLEKLRSITVQDFSKVPNHHSTLPEINLPLFSKEQKGHFIYIEPIKDLKLLTLSWELPKQFASVNQKWALDLVSYLLNQRSDTSLISLLKKQGLAEALTASSDRLSFDTMLFNITIKLTDAGLSKLDSVITDCYETLARFKQTGIPILLFEEMQKLATIEYQYQSRGDPFEWISDVAYSIADEGLATFPAKTQIPSSFNPSTLASFLEVLTPESCAYFVVADPLKTGAAPTQIEKWSDVPYTIVPISPAKLLSWQHAPLNPAIQIPTANPFIPVELSLLSSQKEGLIVPKKIASTEKLLAYYAPDSHYLTPESTLFFRIHSPLIDGTASSSSSLDLLIKSLRESLSETLSFAENAALMAQFRQTDLSLQIQISGLSEKAPLLAKQVVHALETLEVSPSNFEIYKKSLSTNYSNALCELPFRLALENLSNILLSDAPTSTEKLAAISKISYDDFCTFVKEFRKKLYIESLFYGNLSESTAEDLTALLSKFIPTPYLERQKEQILTLPMTHGPFKLCFKTDRQGCSTLLAIQQGEFSSSKKAIQQVLSIALQEAFFDTLRTKQQTGYIAKSWDLEIDNQLLQTFVVQSSSYLPEELLIRFEIFLEDFFKRLPELISIDRFHQLKLSQITTLEMPPENLNFMAQRLDRLAFVYQGDFSRIQKQIASLQELSYEEFLEGSKAFLSKNNPRRIAILIEGEPSELFQYEEVSKEELQKIGTFVTDSIK